MGIVSPIHSSPRCAVSGAVAVLRGVVGCRRGGCGVFGVVWPGNGEVVVGWEGGIFGVMVG